WKMTRQSIGPTSRRLRRFLSKRNQTHGVISAPLHQQRRQRTSNNECLLPERFPSPWTAEVTPNCFIVRDASGQQVAYVYYECEPGRQFFVGKEHAVADHRHMIGHDLSP